MGYVAETYDYPLFRTPPPGMDVDLTWNAATHIREYAPDQLSIELMLTTAPFHTYWLAYTRMFLGDSILVHRIFMGVFCSFTVVLLFFITRRIFHNTWTAAAASLMYMSLPSTIYFDTIPLKVSMELFLLALLLLLLLLANKPRSSRVFITIGISMGLLVSCLFLSQKNTFLYFFVLFSYLLCNKGIPSKKRLLILSCVSGVVLVSLIAYQNRQYLPGAGQHPTNLPQAGIHVYIGFNPDATGSYITLDQIPALGFGQAFHGRMMAEIESGQTMSPTEADQYYLHKAWLFVRQNPVQALKLLGLKAAHFVNDYEMPGNDNLYVLQRSSFILRNSPMGYGWLVVFAVPGLIDMIRGKKRHSAFLLVGFFSAVLAANLITFVSWRYRLHAIIPLIILGSRGITVLFEQVGRLWSERNSYRKQWIRTFMLIILPIAVTYPITFHETWANAKRFVLNSEIYNLKASEQAEEVKKKLRELEARPNLSLNEKHFRAILLASIHRYSDAYHQLREITGYDLQNTTSNRVYLNYLLWLGDYKEARDFVDRVKSNHYYQYRKLAFNSPMIQEVMQKFVISNNK